MASLSFLGKSLLCTSFLKVKTDRVVVSSEKFMYLLLLVDLGNESPTCVRTWSPYKVCMHWYGLLT